MHEYVSNRVQHFRAEACLTQEELAEKVGVSRQTIVAIEGGHYTPSVLLALKIARYFKVPVGEIFQIAYDR